MKRLALIFALSLVFISSIASAYSGNEILQHFEGGDVERNYAHGFVDGAISVLDAEDSICLPKVTHGQIHDVVKQFLKENPAKRHLSAVLLVLLATNEAWPCPKEQGE